MASSTRRRGPQSTSHKTHMAWAVTCHLPPARPFLLLVFPSPTTIRRGVSVLHAVFPSACVCVYGHDGFCPPLPIPPFEPDGLAGWLLFETAAWLELLWSSVATVPPVPSASSCVASDPVRLVKSVSSASVASVSSHSAPLCRILPPGGFCCLTPRLSSCSQKLAHQQEMCSQRPWREGEGNHCLWSPPSSPSYGCP